MPVLSRYIITEILKSSILTMFFLVSLFNIFTFNDELQKVGEGSYTIGKIFEYLALITPRLFYELMPSAALLGSLFAVGAMANNREIVAIKAIGLSPYWVIKNIMEAGLILIAIATLVGEFIAPDTERDAQLLRSTSLNNEVVLRSQYGMWLREGNQFINVRKVINDNALSDIRIYTNNDNNHLASITHAENAEYIGDQKWRLSKITKSILGENKVSATTEEEAIWESAINSKLLQVTVVDSDNLSIIDLYNYINFLKNNNQKSQKYELALWGRVINPFVIFVMIMVSAPFVIGIGRGTSSGARIMAGILIGICFNISDKIFSNYGLVYDINPLLIAILPSTIVLCGALYALKLKI